MNNVWFITGAGRGMGVDIARAALAAGHTVVATGRNTDKVLAALGPSANLLVVKLDGKRLTNTPVREDLSVLRKLCYETLRRRRRTR